MSDDAPAGVGRVTPAGVAGANVDLGGGPPTVGAATDAAGGRLPYPVHVAAGLLDAAGAVVQVLAPAHRYALVTDATVAPLHAERVAAGLPAARTVRVVVPPGEGFKTRETWARVTDELLAAGCGRDTTVVAVGGGVVTDLAGFVAATFMRGVPVVQVPTTLLAMIDASVGGKTGVDTSAGKNLVGAFHPPAAVLVDPRALGTLPARELVAGLAEALKHGVVADAAYFEEISAALPALAPGSGHDGSCEEPGVRESAPAAEGTWVRLIARSIAIKAEVVSRDEREGGLRKVLNFGHTVGHAVEALSGWRLLHGEAVAIGMVVEADAAERAGIADAGTAARVADALRRAGLPVRRPADVPADAIVAATRGDKKARAGQVEYALPVRVGEMAAAGGRWAVPLPDALVREVLG